MNVRTAILTLASTVLFCASIAIAQAQQIDQLAARVIPDAEVANTISSSASASLVSGAASSDGAPAPQSGTTPKADPPTPPANDDQWHLSVSPYLWFPGVHGTVGALGHEAGFKASPSDLLSNFRFGIMGLGEARRNRIITNLDLIWLRLEDDKALPFPDVGATSATIKATEFLLTPKVGYRLVDGKMIKADALAGFRYFYFGENVQFNPGTLGLNFSKSQSWVDPVVGGRIEMALSPKVAITTAGDVGGWGTGSQLEYQVVGLLGYRLKPNLTLQAGYRYLYFDKDKGGTNDFATVVTSGVLFGFTMNLK